MQIKLDFSTKNIGYYPMIIDKARMELREKNEEAAMLSPDNGRYKKSEAREKRLG